MTFEAIVAFIKALPALVEMVNGLREDIKQARREAVEKELAEFKAKVSADIKQIIGAKTNEERLRLAANLNSHLGL